MQYRTIFLYSRAAVPKPCYARTFWCVTLQRSLYRNCFRAVPNFSDHARSQLATFLPHTGKTYKRMMEATKDIFFVIGNTIKTFKLQLISPSVCCVVKIFGAFSTCKCISIHTINRNSTSITKRVTQSLYKHGQALRVPGGWGPQISRQSTHESGDDVTGRLYQRPPPPKKKTFACNTSHPKKNSARYCNTCGGLG